jgi:hypothetical protein
MGQYYKPCFINKETNRVIQWGYSHDFDNGLKLMEHSWIENNFVRFIEAKLIQSPMYLVWAGDYAPNEILTESEIEKFNIEGETGLNLYSLSEYSEKLEPSEDIAPLRAKYLINFDKKQFVNKSKMPKDKQGWKIHPLPLLTCEGNSQGGGDYFSDNGKKFIGIWGRDLIGIVSKKTDIPKGFEEIVPNFLE